MKQYTFDAVVIGGGAAGMAAALELEKNDFTVAIIEREAALGGILLQCIHNGFGLHEFKEELTGPEYAEKFADRVGGSKVTVFLDTTLSEISDESSENKSLYCYSATHGVFTIMTRVLVMAVGSRERNRGNIGLPGTRPTGVFTAGLAQRFVNIDGFLPGKDVVIVGSGDIGLIMSRRMTWAGAKVHAVLEIQEYPSGITRNIVQCLNDFGIPLYLGHVVTNIYGKDRVEKIDVTPLKEGRPDFDKTFSIECDTLLLSVGLVPENELLKKMGVQLYPQTNGPLVDSTLMTNVPGVFACGNGLHIHDLVDFVSDESKRAGMFAARYLRGEMPSRQFRVRTGPNVRYTAPNKFNPDEQNKFFLRSMIVKQQASLEVKVNGIVVKKMRKNHVQPSEMISFTINPDELKAINFTEDTIMEIGLY